MLLTLENRLRVYLKIKKMQLQYKNSYCSSRHLCQRDENTRSHKNLCMDVYRSFVQINVLQHVTKYGGTSIAWNTTQSK